MAGVITPADLCICSLIDRTIWLQKSYKSILEFSGKIAFFAEERYEGMVIVLITNP